MTRERLWINIKQTHGLSYEYRREYNSWNGARYRCQSEKHPAWENYGGRGINMCDRWLNSFAAFLEDMGPRPDGTELDRRDNNGNYEPGNCRWVSRSVNQRNKRQLPKRAAQQRRKISKSDQLRLNRLARIDGQFQPAIDKLLAKVAALEVEREQKKQPIRDKIHPTFRPDL